MLNTQNLIELLKKNPRTRRIFCGVLPIDYVPMKRVKRPCSFIVNTDPSTDPGQHWFAVYVPRREKQPIEYFDSLGRKPHQPQILEFIRINSSPYMYNNIRIQSTESINCGKFALLYLYYRARGYTMKQYLNFFDKYDLALNDCIVNGIFQKIVNK